MRLLYAVLPAVSEGVSITTNYTLLLHFAVAARSQVGGGVPRADYDYYTFGLFISSTERREGGRAVVLVVV